MFRWVFSCWVFVVLLFVSFQATPAVAQPPAAAKTVSPAAVAAKLAFEQIQKQWADLYVQLQKKEPRRLWQQRAQ